MTKVAYMLGALERGGTETLLLDTLKEASRLRVPCLLIHRKQGVLHAEFVQTGVSVYHNLLKHSLDFGYVVRLRKRLRLEGIQIVHAQLPLDAFLAYWACLGTGIKLVLSLHGYDVDYGKLARKMLGFIIRHTNLNIYVSQHLHNHFVSTYSLGTRDYQQKIVYNGLDFNKLDQSTQASIRSELGIRPDTLLIGSVGNFVTGRDQLTVCRFLGELENRGIDFQFVFMGARSEITPALYDKCLTYCTAHGLMNRVHFLGSRHDVPAILHQLDAFVYASDHDTFGIAVVEAMAVGLPVFVNDWAVMQEITQDGKWATIYKTRNIDDLTDRFIRFIQARDSYNQQAKKNAVLVRQNYSIEQHFQTLHEHYRALIQ